MLGARLPAVKRYVGRVTTARGGVALIATDQRMPAMTGIEMPERARADAPDSKFLLLTAYADTDVAIKAINDIGLDYYLLKPWDPPKDLLYPVVDDLLGDWQAAHPDRSSDVRVVGHPWSERSYEVKSFLARNHVPYRWFDIERDVEARRLSDLADATAVDLPLVLVPDGDTLRAPSTLDLADALGLRTRADQPLYDVCIVGGGPPGLAAAVYAASEGLTTVIVEREARGGQAGQSGLAHEINNPASAATRCVEALQGVCGTLLSSLRRLAEDDTTAEQFTALDALRREAGPPVAVLDRVDVADHEEALSSWLADHGVADEWAIAPPLAAAAVDIRWRESAAAVLPGSALESGLEWVASAFSVTTLLAELKESTRRISELVGAVKSYSQMDRGSLSRTSS